MLNEGDVIRGRYKLLAHLGDGGSASVWKALDRTLEREVAIKFLYCSDERRLDQLRKQFLREARIACAVKHRNVIQTMDFGQTDDGQAYMVMELLTGLELAARIGTDPPMPLAEIVQVISLTLRGLQAIHEAGIIHRDLKPENIYLERDQEGAFPKILDFGIAKSSDPHGSKRSVLTTKEGIIVGTPEYMSPEQARGLPDIDARSDIWSLGVVLFELLSGEQPFKHKYAGELIIQIATTDAPRVTELNPDIPEALADVVARALARERSARFQSAAEMQAALLAAADGIHGRPTARSLSQTPAVPIPGKRNPARVLIPLAGAGLVAIALASLLRAPSPVIETPPGANATTATPKAPATVIVELRGVPDDATVLVNGKPVAGTRLEFDNDAMARLIEVQAVGRRPFRVMHPAGNGAAYEVRMPAMDPPVANNPAPSTRPAAAAPATERSTTPPPPAAPRPAATPTDDSAPVPATSAAPTPAKSSPRPAPTERPARPKVWRDADF